MLVLFVKVPTT